MSRAIPYTPGPAACALAAFALAVLASLATPARAEDGLPDELRMNAEHAFLDGRLQDLPVILDPATTPTDRFPLALAAHWWRRTPQTAGSAGAPGEGLGGARIAWARAGRYKPPYPLPGGGARDPYPLITALVLDRIQRETVGAKGLPENSPLEAYLAATGGGRTRAEGEVVQFALAMQRRSYVGDDDPAAMARLDKHANRVANQARVIYLGLLGSLLVSAFLATLFVSRSRPPHPDNAT